MTSEADDSTVRMLAHMQLQRQNRLLFQKIMLDQADQKLEGLATRSEHLCKEFREKQSSIDNSVGDNE